MKTYIRPEVACYDFELNYIIASSSYEVSDKHTSSNTGDIEWDSRENKNNADNSNMWNSGW